MVNCLNNMNQHLKNMKIFIHHNKDTFHKKIHNILYKEHNIILINIDLKEYFNNLKFSQFNYLKFSKQFNNLKFSKQFNNLKQLNNLNK